MEKSSITATTVTTASSPPSDRPAPGARELPPGTGATVTGRAPSKGPTRHRWSPLALLATATALIFAGQLVIESRTLVPEAPLGQVSLQFATDPAAADRVVSAWSREGVTHLAAAGVGFDYLLLLAYATSLVVAGIRLSRRSPSRRWHRAGRVVTVSGIAAAVVDAIENALLLAEIGGEFGLAPLVGALASTKFGLIGLGLVLLAGGAWATRPGTTEHPSDSPVTKEAA